MSRYRKIDVRIWNDEKFCQMSDEGKLCFIFVMTHPNMTPLGAMRATLGGLAEELGWSSEAFRKAFGEALSKGMAEHDPKAHFVGLPNFVKYNQPENPNVIKAWAKCLDLIPECRLKTKAIQRAASFVNMGSKAFHEAFAKAFGEDFAKGMGKQEPEQEQEQEPHSRWEEGSREVTYPRGDMRAPFPKPNSVDAGAAFLIEQGVRGVPKAQFQRMLESLMNGQLTPFDIEDWAMAARGVEA